VGATPQNQVEKAMMTAPAGDFVVRESARTPGAFVLMVKLTATTGIQKRIFYKQGKYQMDGSLEVFASMVSVIRTEPAGGADRSLLLSMSKSRRAGATPHFPHCLPPWPILSSCSTTHLIFFFLQLPRSLCLSESNISMLLLSAHLYFSRGGRGRMHRIMGIRVRGSVMHLTTWMELCCDLASLSAKKPCEQTMRASEPNDWTSERIRQASESC
jgi:hypothetical protein